MTTTLLQVDFPFSGPWGPDMAAAMTDLARDIAGEPGLLWKIWTEDPVTARAGGVYLFNSAEAARAYSDKHLARLKSFGIEGIVAHHFAVNETLSDMTHFKAPN